MNIERLYILPVGSDEARIYEWTENHLTLEELLAFMAVRGKMPSMKRWIENKSTTDIQDAV